MVTKRSFNKFSRLEQLVFYQKPLDKFILDDENAIIVIDDKNGKLVIHERLIGNKLVEINRWPIGFYYCGLHDRTPIKELGLFKIQNNNDDFNALYDYIKGEFVIPRYTWDRIEFGYENEFLKRYNGILASFSISSDKEKDDEYKYINPVTNVKIKETFKVSDGIYYAILNLDGTIRGNKLLKGNSFSRISEIIDLNKYESLEKFKKERKKFCNDTKNRRKQEYYQLLESRNDGSISPYLDNEVIKILNLNNN